jgi:hypothetical protein
LARSAEILDPRGYRQNSRRASSPFVAEYALSLFDDDALARMAMWNIVLLTLLGVGVSVLVETVLALGKP